MRLSSFPVLAALLPINSATSFHTCSLHPKEQFCIDAPTTKAETPLSPRGLPTQSLTWKTPNSQTSIKITLIRKIPGLVVINVLDDIYNYVSEHISLYHDSTIAGGAFDWEGPQNLVLQVVNANNHQTTWGVLGSAVEALRR